jgi:8-oxo-dGTP pyrophosphatase MutT (NUDIX family)
MTTQEKEKILTTDFDALWDDLCVIRDSKFYKYGKIRAKEKFENQNIKDLFKDTSSIWDLPSWGFPKGRRYSQKETDIQCATREFIEETNLDREHFRIIFTKPYMEVYTGTNDVRYKHIYYIAIVSKDAPLPIIDPLNQYQCAEIGDIGWFTLEDALELIKPYNEEKKVVLRQADALLKNYVY